MGNASSSTEANSQPLPPQASIPNTDHFSQDEMDIDENDLKTSDEKDTGDAEAILQVSSTGTVEYNGTIADYVAFDNVNGQELKDQVSLNLKDLALGGTLSQEDPLMLNLFKATLAAMPIDGFSAPGRKPWLNRGEGGSGGPDGDDDDDPFKGVTLDDVGGLETQKEWLKQCVLKHLKNKNSNYSWGVKPPKGVLFYGPPGTGKTLLARAFGNEISKELQRPVKFFHRKGGDMFSKWFGESSENLRQIFKEAIDSKPSIIFFDELDGLCPSRDGDIGEAYNTIVTTLLGLMDTLPVGEVFIFGATNRLDAVDPAMLRPGRFDKHLEFLPPNLIARKKILQINTAKWKRDSQPLEKDLEKLGQCTVGFSGADIEKLCREAFFAAFDRHVPDANLDASIDDLKVLDADWNVALKKTKPTDMAVFRSTLYIPRLPDKAVNPLVVNIQKDIVNKLVKILPKRSPAAIDLGESKNIQNSATISSFLMWDSSSLSVDVMESMILPGIFVHPEVSEYPVYILSQENILNNPPSTQLSYITDTLNQALNSFKPCILYFPRLHDLVADANRNPFISRQLLQFRGKPVLLLATSAGPHSDLPAENNIRNIFGGTNSSWPVRTPNNKERLDFFRSMFETLGNSEKDVKSLTVPAATKEKLDKLMQLAVEQTANDSIELILGLHDALQTTFVKYFKVNDKKNLPIELTKVLREYARNKLQL